jgi:RimJ/RimL family protein N-acetyltransferase
MGERLRGGTDVSAPVLTDGSVTVRGMQVGDVDGYVAAFRDDPELANLLGDEEDAEADDVLRWVNAAWAEPPGFASWEFAIADTATDTFLGTIMLHSCDWKNRRAETRFWLTPQARGHGVLSRALDLVLEWAFGELALERMELTALPENAAVPRIAEKFGYVFEGTMRKRNFERGRRVDLRLWGLLRDERTERVRH